MSDDCVNCNSKCCMAGVSYSALLTEEEKKRLDVLLKSNPELCGKLNGDDFCYYDKKVGAYKMKKFSDNRCVFWNPQTFRCRVYDARPADCKIFPLEYRWFRWLHSPQCPSKNFSKSTLIKQLDSYTPDEVRHLKLLHMRTPDSTQDRLWIIATKILPITFLYAIYAKIRSKKNGE